MTPLTLIAIAREALPYSYSPYSHFQVAAALLAASGKVYTGVNVENASYGATICAERTAFVKAISEGERAFTMLAIVSSSGDLTWPCGICRQVLAEFCDDDFKIVSMDREKQIKTYQLKELLPEGFKL